MSKLVVIASTLVDEEGIWRNGLYQNIYLFCELFCKLGFDAQLFINNPDEHKESLLVKKFKVFDINTLRLPTTRIHALLEIGMNCGDQVRNIFRSRGAKIVKIYLGNIMNIDMELPLFMKDSNFPHHLPGHVDEAWVSPHYASIGEYARALTHIDKKAQIAPYIWDPCFITKYGTSTPTWIPSTDAARSFTVIEPNISFQKCSFLPLMIMEAYYRKHPAAVDKVHLINGDKLAICPYFKNTVMPHLEIVRAGKVEFAPRMSIMDIVAKYPSNVVVAHQITNELNYIALEHFYMGFPYVHNSTMYGDAGYYYEGNSIDAGVAAVERAVESHDPEKYRLASDKAIYKYSMYNPEVQRSWTKLINSI